VKPALDPDEVGATFYRRENATEKLGPKLDRNWER
jgi:hypothetical protein